MRSQVLDTIRPVAAAWSVNGRDVDFVVDFDLPIEAGGFVTVTTAEGARYLVQIHGLSVQSRTGISLDLDAAELGLGEIGVRGAAVDIMSRMVEGHGLVLSRLDEGPADAPPGFDDARIEPAADDAVAAYLAGSLGDSPAVEIGRLRNSSVAARLKPEGFARHTFMCGQSGSGKTFSLGVVLERLLDVTDIPVVIIDPNSDYVNLGKVAGRAAINRFRDTPMSRSEYDELKERYGGRAGVRVASARGGDLGLRIHLSDLTIGEQALAMQLDPIEDPGEYHALVEVTRSFEGRVYDVADLEQGLRDRFDDSSRRLAQRIANLGLADWSVWARSDEETLADLAGRGADGRIRQVTSGDDRMVLVLDTGSLADPRERSVVALAVLGRLRRRPRRAPIAVVIDEAHNVCPPDARSSLDRAVTDLALWIAGEGRKYGIYLLLSTQRPQKIHRNVLSQCDNLLLMRVNSATDIAELTEIFSHVPASMIEEASSHRMGEMLAAGKIAPTPLRLQVGVRWTKEGGSDLPTDWIRRPG